ncbi:phosphopantetheine-binding protein [Streptomyces sp. NPDC031705]|uniref:acyl carrier protein n=1 Tax=Streptomyces sp. NPDC031705 TaxID=3155729 RepID=UPI0033FB3A63
MNGATPPLADMSALEGEVVALVAEHLGLSEEQVRRAPSLFDLPGFDSLAVVAVLEGLEERTGHEIPPERIVPEAFESIGSVTALFPPAGPPGSDCHEKGTA